MRNFCDCEHYAIAVAYRRPWWLWFRRQEILICVACEDEVFLPLVRLRTEVPL